MADLNGLFEKFNEKITLTITKKENLKKGRNALREKISKYFIEQEKTKPKYHGQGSYAMNTMVNPLPGKEYDIDDGIYLEEYFDKNKEDWPSTYEVHNWIYNAVFNHTKVFPEDKDTCIRVKYSGEYHIDLPCYIVKDDIGYLANKSIGWIESDPKEFTNWFIDKKKDKGEQLRNIVKYLKAWKDYQELELKGIACTILCCNEFYGVEKRDDKALLGTLINIIETLEAGFECKKPVTPYEDIFRDYEYNEELRIKRSLVDLKESLEMAINERDVEKASEYLIEQFGDRFPRGKSEDQKNSNEFVKTERPGVLKNDGRSA